MKRIISNRSIATVLVVLLAVLWGAAQQATDSHRSTVPPLVKFSGAATDINGKPLSGMLGITFALYKDQQGGAPLWLETQSVSVDKAGHYTVSLGVTKTDGLPADIFASGEAKWLSTQIEGQSEQSRVLLLSVPYALKAADAETIGGLPPSAFVLAAPASSVSDAATEASGGAATSTAPPPATITGSGTTNFVPLFTGAATVGNSVVFQSGTGGTAKIGINTSTPGVTLDVKGAANVQGLLTLPATGTATTTAGKPSQAQDLVASSFSSSSSAAVNQTFQWKAEPTGNNTATPSGTLNLLFGSGTTAPAETGLKLSSKGLFTFATGQTFPGAGTITGVTAGSGLAGGGTTGAVTLSLLKTCSANQVLQWNGTAWACATVSGSGTITGVTAGTDLTGGGTSGNVTLNLNTAALQTSNDARYAQLGANNIFTKTMTFAAGQTFPGAGTVTSVGLAAPSSDFTVSSSPITTAGTLNLGWTVAPTSANTANAIVKRDSLGNFATNSVTASSIISSGVTATTVTAGTLNVTNFNPSGTISVNTASSTALSGISSAVNGTAVIGSSSAATGASWGVLGVTASSDANAKGVAGTAFANSGNTEGMNGVSESPTGIGVVGQASSNAFSSAAQGLIGIAPIGTMGDSSDIFAMGVLGTADDGYGGLFANNSQTYGIPTLEVESSDPTFVGYLMEADYNPGNGSLTTMMYLDDSGNLAIAGNIFKSGGAFRIDHPVDPANKYLYHSFVESPDMMNIYNGLVILDDAGAATVTLPDWFEALNRDFRYQLTSIGAPGPNLYVAEEVSGNQFKIAGGKPGAKVSWQVTGVRHDAWANAHRIPTEVEKVGPEKGKYLNPQLYGLTRGEFGVPSKTARRRAAVAKK